MKNSLVKLLAVVTAVLSAAAFCSCSSNGNSTTSESTLATQNVQSTTQSAADSTDFDMKSLQSFDAESKDPFAGAWHITAGEGSKLSTFTYMFDGNGKADIIVDNMGYCGTYAKKTDSTDGNGEKANTFICQLMFGINGTYTYQFSDSNQKLVLTNTDDNKTTTMEKLESFDCVPIPDKNPVTDTAILGAWKSKAGEYYYFDKNGLMYNNQYGTMFTYYKYSAKDGKITAKYKMQKENTDNHKYSVEGNTLTLDGTEYTKISTSELDKF